MLTMLISSFFGWLPAGLWLPVCAVIGVTFFAITVKVVTAILDFVFKFIDIFT